MKLNSFRITNFRSISDSGWINLSSDNITGLIGQNESGKSSVLESLIAFYNRDLDEDCVRSNSDYPEITCSFISSKDEWGKIAEGNMIPQELIDLVEQNNYRINITVSWKYTQSVDEYTFNFEDANIREYYNNSDETKNEKLVELETVVEEENSTEQMHGKEAKKNKVDENVILDDLWAYLPVFSFFEEDGNLLPKEIDIDQINSEEDLDGKIAVQNLLKITQLDITNLIKKQDRMKESKIREVSEKITKDFQNFWSQYLGGQNNKIVFEFELRNHPDSESQKAGKPYLVFYIKDLGEILHPSQRSKGVRWFLSFFLYLRANDFEKGNKVILVDEPGNSLHSKAKRDILKLIENINSENQIILTTHYPELIEIDKLYRMIAVERVDNERGDTFLLSIHDLYSASAETLTPIYECIGMDFSHQHNIPKENNILLEEPSAFYYLKAFKELLEIKDNLYFIPSTGVTKLPFMCNVFLGWGLGYVAVMDDDSNGRKVYRDIKHDLFGDELELYENKLHKLDVKGIEDLFSKTDAKKHILKDINAVYTEDTSEYINKIKSGGKISKLISAVNFYQDVIQGHLTKADLGNKTITKFEGLFQSLISKLQS